MESSEKHQQEQRTDPTTTVIKSKAGHTIMVECVTETTGDESARGEKTDDESRKRMETDVATQEETESELGDETTGSDEDFEEEQSVVEFENPACELSQSYEIEQEYENMTKEQEAAEVQALTPHEQAKYRELIKLHQ